MIKMPQTHVYAEGVVGTSSTNFKVAPVMGTNLNFEHGTTAAINCELYDTPKQMLGYFAKYTVNEAGTGFDTSHDENQVSLVNWKVAKDFLKERNLRDLMDRKPFTRWVVRLWRCIRPTTSLQYGLRIMQVHSSAYWTKRTLLRGHL